MSFKNIITKTNDYLKELRTQLRTVKRGTKEYQELKELINKVYNASELLTTMYSSAANNNYVNFMHNVFENEIINKDNITITQTSNILFNIYSGTKYLITKESDLITFLVGADGDMDLANKMVEFVEEKSPFIEVEIMDTNQPIYSYLISGIK